MDLGISHTFIKYMNIYLKYCSFFCLHLPIAGQQFKLFESQVNEIFGKFHTYTNYFFWILKTTKQLIRWYLPGDSFFVSLVTSPCIIAPLLTISKR